MDSALDEAIEKVYREVSSRSYEPRMGRVWKYEDGVFRSHDADASGERATAETNEKGAEATCP